MRKTAALLVLASVLVCLAAAPAVAQSELDQSHTDVTEGFAVPWDAKQTFTAQKTGTLDKVSIHARCCYYPEGDEQRFSSLYLEINGTQSDPPATRVPVYEGFDGWVDVPLDPAPFVEAGKQYEIILSAEGGFYTIGWGPNTYPGGQLYFLLLDSTNALVWTPYGGEYEMAFKTYVTPADTTAPNIESVSPANGASGVARGSKVTANFSEAVRADTLNSDTVRLFSGNSTKPIKATLSKTPTSVTLTPSQKLDAKTRYTAKIKGGPSGVKDLAGNPLASDFSWSFTTGSM